jgi:ABC-type transport system involved in multi-copper enzyme maturation permease subunit
MLHTGHLRRFACLAHAEFLKIFDSRMPAIYCMAAFFAVYLWVFDLYHVEQINTVLKPKNFIQVLPVLFRVTWTSLLFHVGIIAFVTYWVAVDSQYGMIRVTCAQPVSRIEFLLARCTAISVHVVVITSVFLASVAFWPLAYSGAAGVTSSDALMVARCFLHALVFTMAVAWIAMAAALFRRSVGSALVGACITFIALGFLSVMPHDLLPPRFVFMRYFVFPLGDLVNPWGALRSDNPFRQMYPAQMFYLVMLVTPLLFFLPAAIDFHRRDISE